MKLLITFLRALLQVLFRFRTHNAEVLSQPGPVLLVPNHVSWLDWMFLGVSLDLDWKFVVSSATANTTWLHRRIMINRRTFPVDTASPYAVKYVADYLKSGGRLVLFAEGRISATGSLMKLFAGTGFLLLKSEAKVITCYLRGAKRLRWVKHGGWTRWRPRVEAFFSEVHTPPAFPQLSTTAARERITDWLYENMVRQQFETELQCAAPSIPEAILAMERERPDRIVLEDINRQQLSLRTLLIGADVLAVQLRTFLHADTSHVGLLLPNLNATPVVLMSLWRLGKIPAILNYSNGIPMAATCAKLAGLRQIITAHAFAEKARLDLTPLEKAGFELLYLEDLRARITAADKWLGWMRTRWFPHPAIDSPPQRQDTAVILFTSGSEGTPKGVELTHENLLANIHQMLAVTDIEDDDRVFNALPLFHSFGLTIGTLLPLVRGIYAFLYPSPLHYRVVPNALYNLDCTIFASTNTFLNGYARKGHPYDFRSLKYLFAGAEKLQKSTFQHWSEHFGVRILEGYGATECSPTISVNTPMHCRPGTAGKILPGIACRLKPMEGVEEGGRLQVRGPNVMKGYLNQDANREFQAGEGWYDTGDIAAFDHEGFLRILGRMKRFAKISGEMVSLAAVEDALAGAFPQYGLRCTIAVISVPDERKGEALVAVTNEPKIKLGDIRQIIQEKGMTNLCAPSRIETVREIPKLGTGKIHHRELVRRLQEEGRI